MNQSKWLREPSNARRLHQSRSKAGSNPMQERRGKDKSRIVLIEASRQGLWMWKMCATFLFKILFEWVQFESELVIYKFTGVTLDEVTLECLVDSFLAKSREEIIDSFLTNKPDKNDPQYLIISHEFRWVQKSAAHRRIECFRHHNARLLVENKSTSVKEVREYHK